MIVHGFEGSSRTSTDQSEKSVTISQIRVPSSPSLFAIIGIYPALEFRLLAEIKQHTNFDISCFEIIIKLDHHHRLNPHTKTHWSSTQRADNWPAPCDLPGQPALRPRSTQLVSAVNNSALHETPLVSPRAHRPVGTRNRSAHGSIRKPIRRARRIDPTVRA